MKIKKDYYIPLSILASGAMISLAVYFAINPFDPASLRSRRAGLASASNEAMPLPTGAAAAKIRMSPEDDALLGAATAKVTLVEFTDYQCPFCSSFFQTTYPRLKQEYIETGKVKFVVRDFPIPSLHPNAQKSSEATECAKDQNKFWEMHDALFQKQSEWSRMDTNSANSYFKNVAKSLGVEESNFNACFDNARKQAEVAKDVQDGQAASVDGTPAFFVTADNPNDANAKWVYIKGAQPFARFQQEIDALLN